MEHVLLVPKLEAPSPCGSSWSAKKAVGPFYNPHKRLKTQAVKSTYISPFKFDLCDV